MKKYDRVVCIATLNGTLAERGELLRRFQEAAISYQDRGEVTGILLYGDGYIFHCFECRQGGMDKLKADVEKSSFHHTRVITHDEVGVAAKFTNWRMLYVLKEPSVQAFMQQHQWRTFNPYLLKDELLSEFMQVIYGYSNINQSVAILPPGQPVNAKATIQKKPLPGKKFYIVITIMLVLVVAIVLSILRHYH